MFFIYIQCIYINDAHVDGCVSHLILSFLSLVVSITAFLLQAFSSLQFLQFQFHRNKLAAAWMQNGERKKKAEKKLQKKNLVALLSCDDKLEEEEHFLD